MKCYSYILFSALLMFSKIGAASSTLDLDFSILSHETCPSNGMISMQLQNGDPSSEVTYFIINAISDTVGVVHDSTGGAVSVTLGGLEGGQYDLLAIYSHDSTYQQIDTSFIILSQYDPLSVDFIVSPELCGADGSIEFNVVSGSAVEYRMISPAPIVVQTTPHFTGLSAGDYIFEIEDSCGAIETKEVTLEAVGHDFEIPTQFQTVVSYGNTPCDSVLLTGHMTAVQESVLAYPVNFRFVVHFDDGTPDFILDTMIQSGNPLSINWFNVMVPYLGAQVNSNFDFIATDNCGLQKSRNGIVIVNDSYNYVDAKTIASHDENGCGIEFSLQTIHAKYPYSINFTQSPVGFDPVLFNSEYPGPFSQEKVEFSSPTLSVPSGQYIFQIVDACGDTAVAGRVMDTIPLVCATTGYAGIGTGSLPGTGSMRPLWNKPIQDAELISGPVAFSSSYPVDVSSFIEQNGNASYGVLRMADIPAGTYAFQVMDTCGLSASCTYTLPGYADTFFSLSIDTSCTKFDISIDHQTNYQQTSTVIGPLGQFHYLQWKNENGVWLNMDDSPHNLSVLTGHIRPQEISNPGTLNNIQKEGQFRIISVQNTLRNGPDVPLGKTTMTVLSEFEMYHGGFKFDSLYSVLCYNGLYTVICDVQGNNLEYRVSEIDGTVQNNSFQSSFIFENLPEGLYKIEVRNDCGSIKTREIDLTEQVTYNIEADSLCIGRPGRLFVSYLPFYTYEWYEASNPSDILSTSNELIFSNFDPAVHNGTYLCQLEFQSPSACLDRLLNFEIEFNTNGSMPFAGGDAVAQVCDSLGDISLFQFLLPGADMHGVWYSADGEILSPEQFDISTLDSGMNDLVYIVPGLCGGTDTAFLQLSKGDCNPCFELDCDLIAQAGYRILVVNPDGSVGSIDAANQGADNNPSNELQTITITDQTIALSHGGGQIQLPIDDDPDPSNEIQTLSKNGLTIQLSEGGFIQDSILSEADIDLMVSDNGYITSEVDGDPLNELQTIARNGAMIELSHGGGVVQDSVLSENAVDAMVSNNGYLLTEVDGDSQNEIQTINRAGNTIVLSHGGGAVQDSVLTESAVISMVTDYGFIENEVDGDSLNEIQYLNISGDSLFLSKANYVILPGLSKLAVPVCPQARLDRGESPLELYEDGVPLDSIFGLNYKDGVVFFIDTAGVYDFECIVVAELREAYLHSDNQTGEGYEFGCSGVDINGCDHSGIGGGKLNMMDAVSDSCELFLALSYMHPGWHVPSIDEYIALFDNVFSKVDISIKNYNNRFIVENFYLVSSTESSSDPANNMKSIKFSPRRYVINSNSFQDYSYTLQDWPKHRGEHFTPIKYY